jgi:hypothetical protein
MDKQETLKAIGLWALGPDTGVSSKAIARGYLSQHPQPWHHMPRDADDFGRCYRLVRSIPSCREGVSVNAQAGGAWRLLHEDWDKLCSLYEEKKLYVLTDTIRIMLSR